MAGNNPSKTAALPPAKKIPVELAGYFPRSRAVRQRFEMSLEINSRKCRRDIFPIHGAWKIRRRNRHDQRTVGILSRPVIVTHPIHDQMPFLRRSIYHISARTHTERVDSPAVFRGMGQLVIRRGKTARSRPVLCAVNKILLMFHAHTDRKRLRLHQKPRPAQHLQSIARTVPDGKYKMACCDFPLPGCYGLSRIHTGNPDEFPLVAADFWKLCIKMEFAAPLLNLPAHRGNHRAQVVGSDMRLILVENFFRRTCLYKDFKHFSDAPISILYHGVQFSVRKGAGSPLSKLHIWFRIKSLPRKETLHRRSPLPHFLAALDHNRLVSRPRKEIGAEHSRRTAPANYGAGWHRDAGGLRGNIFYSCRTCDIPIPVFL